MAHPHTLILLSNLGSPQMPVSRCIRRFLREFLADRRVVDLSHWVWLPILYCFVLPFRPRRLAKAYESIWFTNRALPGETEIVSLSPHVYYSRSLEIRLQRHFSDNPSVVVALGMRYGTHNIPTVLRDVQTRYPTIKNVITLPLFAQYSSTTVAPIMDEVFRYYLNTKVRSLPTLQMIRDYADNSVYIAAIANSLLASIEKVFSAAAPPQHSWKEALATQLPEMAIVLSYHSIPKSYADEGDDYPERCELTTALVKQCMEKQLGIPLAPAVVHVYQSRFGRNEWIGPSLQESMETLPLTPDTPEREQRKRSLWARLGQPENAAKVVKTCFVAAPGFSVDCLETLEEVEDRAAHTFKSCGGRDFYYVPCLNDSPEHVEALVSVVNSYLHGTKA